MNERNGWYKERTMKRVDSHINFKTKYEWTNCEEMNWYNSYGISTSSVGWYQIGGRQNFYGEVAIQDAESLS